MFTLDIYWEPFALGSWTIDRTREQILWAIREFQKPFSEIEIRWRGTSAIRNAYRITSVPDFKSLVHPQTGEQIFGVAFEYSQGQDRRITFNRSSGIERLRDSTFGGVMMHEIGHAQPFNFTHCCSDNDLMDADINLFDWWGPDEIIRLQKTYGVNPNGFRCFPITSRGVKLRSLRDQINESRANRNRLLEEGDRKQAAEENMKLQAARIERLEVAPVWRNFREFYRNVPGAII